MTRSYASSRSLLERPLHQLPCRRTGELIPITGASTQRAPYRGDSTVIFRRRVKQVGR